MKFNLGRFSLKDQVLRDFIASKPPEMRQDYLKAILSLKHSMAEELADKRKSKQAYKEDRIAIKKALKNHKKDRAKQKRQREIHEAWAKKRINEIKSEPLSVRQKFFAEKIGISDFDTDDDRAPTETADSWELAFRNPEEKLFKKPPNSRV